MLRSLRLSVSLWPHVLVGLMLTLTLVVPAPTAVAQVREGATLTVLRGQVALVHPNGTAVQPAPSGTDVHAGDEIRTLTATGALITFFAGSEIEMGADTILVVDRVSQDGTKIDISLKQVLGTTISRVQSLTDPASAYRVEVGGAVAVLRGSTLAARGPETTPSGTFASVACTGCSAISYVQDLRTGEQAPLGPQTFGYTWPVRSGGATGVKEGAFDPFRVDLAGGLENAVAEAITTAEQSEQGDVHGVPAGQVAGGHQQEARTEANRREQDQQDDDHPNDGAVGTSPVVVSGPRFSFQCTPIVPVGDRCSVSASNLAGGQIGGTPQFSIQTLAGTSTHTETFACGTVSATLTAACTVATAGDIFEGGGAQFAFPLATGGQRVLTTNTRCVAARPVGTAC